VIRLVKKNQTATRKHDHIRICLNREVQSKRKTTTFEDIHLIHHALTDVNLEGVDLSTELLGKKLSAPIIIAGMTGGTRRALKINAILAEVAERLGVGMGVGSQRAAIEDPEQAASFTVTRDRAPNALLIANIGYSQLAKGYGVDEAIRAIEMIKADVLAVHLNPLHEAVQAEGETNFRNVVNSIRNLTRTLDIPVMVKETGAGISAEVAKRLEEVGVAAIDIGGAGGTSWAAVEYHRSGRGLKRSLGLTFWDWGIPTAISLVEVKRSTNLCVIATGGVRSGIDAAKAIALGADAVGVALPLLSSAVKASAKVEEKLMQLIMELKVASFLVGADNISKLKRIPVVVTGLAADWLTARGFNPKEFALRSLFNP
jgi:isopentenyl-diphosphate delta-isomerase